MHENIKTARKLSEYCLGRKGFTSIRLDDFKDQYEWKLDEYSNEMHKTILTLELKDFYDLGIFCIKNQITIANIMRQSVLFTLEQIRNNTLEFEVAPLKKIKKPPEHLKVKITSTVKRNQVIVNGISI